MRGSTTGNTVATPQTPAVTYIPTWCSVKFSARYFNTSHLTASSVSVCCSYALRKWKKRNHEQRCAIKFCVILNENTTETCEKLKRAYGEHAASRAKVFRWHTAFLDGREIVEEEHRSGRPCASKTEENVTKVRDLVRSDRRLTEWLVLTWVPWTTQKKGPSCPARDCWHLNAASRQRSLSHCHLSERIFDQKGYFSGSAATILAWSEPLWLLPFPETQIPPQRSSFWNCGRHTKGRDRPAEGTSTWRLPALLPGVGSTSLAACVFPTELLRMG